MTQDTNDITALLANSHTIAVVGLSAKSDRPSHGVAEYLQQHGYRIIPVNPTYAGTHILGEYCYSSLKDAAAVAKIDIVDCFRKSEHIAPVVDDAIAIGARCVWMQLGVINHVAAARARAAGLAVVMSKCIKIEHAMYMRG